MARRREDRPARVLTGLERKVYDAIADLSGVDVDDITPDSRLVDDIGFDSLDVVELGLDLEEKLSIAFDDRVLDTWTAGTVRDVLAEIGRLQQKAKS